MFCGKAYYFILHSFDKTQLHGLHFELPEGGHVVFQTSQEAAAGSVSSEHISPHTHSPPKSFCCCMLPFVPLRTQNLLQNFLEEI